MRYVVRHDYESGTAGPWRKGEILELDESIAAWVNHDSPGTLAPEKPKRKRVQRKRQNRQQLAASTRSTTDGRDTTRESDRHNGG